MKKYLIHYGSKLHQSKEPLYAYELGKNQITIVALPNIIEGEKRYFENPEGGWKAHLEQSDPLESLASNASYAVMLLPDNANDFKKAKESILKRDGKEVTVTWEAAD